MLGFSKKSTSSQQISENDGLFQIEKRIAQEIMETVQRLELPLKLDQLTEGRGNCFPISIIQQCRRPEILSYLRPKPRQIAQLRNGHSLLRKHVMEFIMKSKTMRVQQFKEQFDELDGLVNGETWVQYWQRMLRDRAWVDFWFVQATAWYLQMDIWIVATSSTESSPYIQISGNLGDDSCPSDGPIITLGTKSNSHYQSLLPIEMLHLEFRRIEPESATEIIKTRKNFNEMKNYEQNASNGENPNDNAVNNQHPSNKNNDNHHPSNENNVNHQKVSKEHVKNTKPNIVKENKKLSKNLQPDSPDDPDFIYDHLGQALVFLKMSAEYIMKCPICQAQTKYIVRHISANTCNSQICLKEFKLQFQVYKKEKAKIDNANRQRIYRAKMVKLDVNKAKENNAHHQRIHQAKMMKLDKNKAKEKHAKKQRIHIARLKEKDPVHLKQTQVKKNRLHISKRKSQNHDNLKSDQTTRQQKHRKIANAADRLNAFKESTLHNAIFICTCCHQRMFKSNVRIFTSELVEQINSKKTGLIDLCIEYPTIPTKIDGQNKSYICLTCVKHMKNQKMPPMSTKNSLTLIETDDVIKQQNLDLTELESALIAKNIIFQKIFQLPKSRWTALKDRVVNVPINESSIINTLDQLPRTPQAAGLIGVALKRKVEYKNSHQHQLIDPDKIFRMLEKLKSHRNPHYQFYDDYNTYQARCKTTDPTGYNTLFADELIEQLDPVHVEQVHELSDELENETKVDESEPTADEKDEIELKTKDPVKKFQFTYNESLCMTSKYPEISANNSSSLNIAPGEGQIPQNIMTDENWDIKAFPNLHNPDGSNGKDQERKVRLTEQNYFIQRICNKEKRFAKSPAYMYAAIAYIEKKQIQRNINLIGTRGKKTSNENGGQAYELNDGYRVLEDIKQTPNYWKKAKYEMLARLDNLGPFQLFFTLSCADMRWTENFAAILLEKGYEIDFSESYKITDGASDKHIRARTKGQNWKPIHQFIDEDLDESLHELVRGNVLTATRYFDHRVKQFINKILMGKNNPMHVKYYTYKVEFQDRGAGHIHGTLWLGLDAIENLVRDNQDGQLRPKTQDEIDDPTIHGWMSGLKSAFKKLRNNAKLNKKDIQSLARFIDEYTTVSIHGNTVGKDVAKIAQEVNKHHHTKTCRKHDTSCRFGYPRFPSPHTIIVEPCNDENPDQRQKTLADHAKILSKVQDVLDNEETINEIMAKYDKQNETKAEYIVNTKQRIQDLCKIAGVSYDGYIKALSTSKSGYSVVQQRDLDEIYINSYNIEWLRAWNANMDIQVVLDFFAVITYVTDYYSKDDTGTMEIIKAALSQTESKDIKEKMRLIANTFLTHRQMGEAEAIYKLLPSLLLKKSNVACQWVSLSTKEDRSSRWKKATEIELNSGRPVIQLDGHDGYWYEQQDMWSKYLRRPMDTLSEMCFAQFAKMYRSFSQSRSSDEQADPSDAKRDDNGDDDDGYETAGDDDTDDKFNFIMTHKTEKLSDLRKGKKLPKYIELSNPYPGEPKMMIKRNLPAVLRYNKINKDNNPKKYLVAELMLYKPVQMEIDVDQAETMYDEIYQDKRKVDIVKAQVMEHLEGVEMARYWVEQVKKDIDLENVGQKLDPTLEQSNADCDDEIETEHPDYSHIDPGQLATENIQVTQEHYKRVVIPNDDELKKNTRSLDKWQRESVNIAIRFAKDIVKARQIGNSSITPPLLMIHGGAGAGKSAVINILAPWMQKILQKDGDNIESPCVIKTAFTGTAASNIDGQTLHG